MENYCSTCARSFSRPEDLQRHNSTIVHQRKRAAEESTPIVVKKIKVQQPPSNEDFNIRLIHRGFEGLFKIYRAQLKRVCKDITVLSVMLISHLLYLVERAVKDTNGLKAQLRCTATFVQEPPKTSSKNTDGDKIEKIAWFSSRQRICLHSTNKEMEIAGAMAEISKQIEGFIQNGSGWVVKEINHVDLYISKYNPIRGTTYTKLPSPLASKKAILNIKNSDEKCFEWAVLAALHPVEKNAERVSKYKQYAGELKFAGIQLPMAIDDIPAFEQLNSLAINVFGYESGLYPLYTTKTRSMQPINMLLLTPPEKPAHYCLIKNLDKLLFSETKHEHRKFVCPYCLCPFNTGKRLVKHQEFCTVDRQRIEMPEDPILKFRNVTNQLHAPYVMFADFECFTKPLVGKDNKTHQHIPNSYGVLGVQQCCKQPQYDKPDVYRGAKPVRHFLETVIHKGERFISNGKEPMNISPSEQVSFESSSECHICLGKMKREDAVRDHCHQCGRFRGAAHSSCNTKLYEKRDVTVFFHNLRRYDGHLIMQEIGTIAKEKGLTLECVPKGMEDYISFTINLKTNGKRWRLRFVDSLAFLNAPLSTLASALPSNQFHCLSRFTKRSDLLKRKGSYPYDLMDSAEKFEIDELPPAAQFFNTMKQEEISNEDYQHAQLVWNELQIRDLGEYHDLYLLTDVLILADVFQSFRGFSMKSFGLDPAHYITLPSFAWDALLKFTGVKLELLQDPDMYHFFSAGIKGGVSVISHRHAEAYHPGVPGYQPPKPGTKPRPHSFIMYLDANNLYGWAMKQRLPMGGFEWVGPLDKLPLEEPGIGYIWEVDLDYPKDLHDRHNDYPMAPERMEISGISPYCRQLKDNLNLPDVAVEKLVPNLLNKRNYIVHHRNLKLYMDHGLNLIKIHRGIRFREGAWMAPYIDFNTRMRQNAESTFDKDLFKLLNNAVFGKSMENVFNYVDVKLVTDAAKYEKLVANPLYKESQPFKGDLTAVVMRKEKAVLSKPIYTGFSVLDLSKTLMYKFHYEYMMRHPDFECKLLFTDTDSLCYSVKTDDIYSIIFKDRDQWFDTSNYPIDHPLHSDKNKKVIGMMTDETDGMPILEFVGLRAKMYSIKLAEEEHMRAKGISRAVVKHELSHQDYKSTLFDRSQMRHNMLGFRSREHEIYTVRTNKSSLSAYDDKRFILNDGIETLAYGHRRILEQNLMSTNHDLIQASSSGLS